MKREIEKTKNTGFICISFPFLHMFHPSLPHEDTYKMCAHSENGQFPTCPAARPSSNLSLYFIFFFKSSPNHILSTHNGEGKERGGKQMVSGSAFWTRTTCGPTSHKKSVYPFCSTQNGTMGQTFFKSKHIDRIL